MKFKIFDSEEDRLLDAVEMKKRGIWIDPSNMEIASVWKVAYDLYAFNYDTRYELQGLSETRATELTDSECVALQDWLDENVCPDCDDGCIKNECKAESLLLSLLGLRRP